MLFKGPKINMKNLLILLLLTTTSFAQNESRKFISENIKKEGLEIKTVDGQYFIKFKTDKIAEVTFTPNNETIKTESHAVILSDQEIVFDKQFSENSSKISSKNISIEVIHYPFQIKFFDKNNKILVSEKAGYTKINDSLHTLDFNLDATEKLYGGGARALTMNRRGNRLQLYNRAHYGYETKADLMNFCIPLVLSSKKYAVHFDNAAIGYLDLDAKHNNTLTYETISGRKTYQIIVGDSWYDLVSNYSSLTGKQPLPPRWAFGNLSSRFGYHSQEEVEKTIRKFQEDQIPVDAIILDLYWFGKSIKGTMGNLDWDKDNFPNPTKMIADLNTKGVKTVVITEPFILSTSSKWQEAVDKKILATDKSGNPATFDFYFGNTGIIDIFKPSGKAWFWNIYKNLINQGVAGLWGDLGEPEVFPSKAITYAGTADEVHNIYGHNWAKLIADGYKTDFANQRPFILMRAGYSGSQRFGMIPWSGDVSRSWGGLQSQTEIALQMGMQGLGYMHSDLGGFAGDYFDNELYIRWLQYGVFQPIFRPHAQEEVASEPVYKDIVTKAQAKKQIELRYQMLPYNYTLAFNNNQTGAPLMRPIFFEESQNEAMQTVCNQYFWGNDFLVHPITKANTDKVLVYFPVKNNWYDFYTDKKYIAGTTIAVATSANYIPTFVRGGSLIPLVKTIQNTSKYTLDTFDLHYYFDPKTNKTNAQLYNDDGATVAAFEKGAYEIFDFDATATNKFINLKINITVGKIYQSATKKVTIIVHNVTMKPKIITVNGQKTDFLLNKKILTFQVNLDNSITKELKIQL